MGEQGPWKREEQKQRQHHADDLGTSKEPGDKGCCAASRQKRAESLSWRRKQGPASLWLMVKGLEFILSTGKWPVVFSRGMTGSNLYV